MILVSILILLEVVLEDLQGEAQGSGHRVSILILLEVVLEDRSLVPISKNFNRFNPYFAGSSSGSNLVKSGGIYNTSFNPYFAGSSSGRQHTDNGNTTNNNK